MSLTNRAIVVFDSTMNEEVDVFIRTYILPIKMLPVKDIIDTSPELDISPEYKMSVDNGVVTIDPLYDESLMNELISQRVLYRLLVSIYENAYSLAILKTFPEATNKLSESIIARIDHLGNKLTEITKNNPDIAKPVLDFMAACQNIEDAHEATFKMVDFHYSVAGASHILMISTSMATRLITYSCVYGVPDQ